jgi:thermitase
MTFCKEVNAMKQINRGLVNTIVVLLALILTTIFFISCGDNQSPMDETPTSLAPQKVNGDFSENTILVKFKPGAMAQEVASENARLGVRIKNKIPEIDVTVLEVPARQAMAMVQKYEQLTRIVEYAEPNGVAYAVGKPKDGTKPNDPFFPLQWGPVKINAPKAWDIAKGSANVRIAINDTGIDSDHEDLAAKTVFRANYTDTLTDDDIYGHGTHCAGIAAGITNNSIGIAGVGWNCSLMSIKVMNDEGWGYYDWIAKGVIYATYNGAKVISMSLGGSSPSLTMKNAVDYAWTKGVVVVAAAGNANTNSAFYPAYYSNCIAIGATDQNDARAGFSNYGSWVDVAAPGVDIYSTLPNHANTLNDYYGTGLYYGYLSGTSMATPHVAGEAGLLWPIKKYGTSSPSVRNRIEGTCDPVGPWVVKGRINAFKAVSP